MRQEERTFGLCNDDAESVYMSISTRTRLTSLQSSSLSTQFARRMSHYICRHSLHLKLYVLKSMKKTVQTSHTDTSTLARVYRTGDSMAASSFQSNCLCSCIIELLKPLYCSPQRWAASRFGRSKMASTPEVFGCKINAAYTQWNIRLPLAID